MSTWPPGAEAAWQQIDTALATLDGGVAALRAGLSALRAELAPVLDQAARWPAIEDQLRQLALIRTVVAEGPPPPPVTAPRPGLTRTTQAVWTALVALHGAQGSPVTRAELARRTGLPRRTILDALARLTQHGWVRREPGPPPYRWTPVASAADRPTAAMGPDAAPDPAPPA